MTFESSQLRGGHAPNPDDMPTETPGSCKTMNPVEDHESVQTVMNVQWKGEVGISDPLHFRHIASRMLQNFPRRDRVGPVVSSGPDRYAKMP